MAVTKTTTEVPPEAAEDTLFSVPLYDRRKPRGDKTRGAVMAASGVLAVAAVAGAIALTSGHERQEVATVTSPAALARAEAMPVTPTPSPMATGLTTPVAPAVVAPTAVARAPVRAAPRMAEVRAPAPEAAPSVDSATADVSALVPEIPATATPVPTLDPVKPAPETPAEAAGALPDAPAEVMP